MNYWLLKSEPDCFGIDHLKAQPRQTAHWDGVRNYQARNFLRDGMQKGDRAFFYHSSCPQPGIAGIVRIVRAGYPDHSAWHPDSEHFDPKSSPQNPIWYMVDVKLEKAFASVIPLAAIKSNPALKNMPLVQRGSRLSVMPVSAREWRAILNMDAR